MLPTQKKVENNLTKWLTKYFCLNMISPYPRYESVCGDVAQLGEHLICIQKVAGSIPVISTKRIILVL